LDSVITHENLAATLSSWRVALHTMHRSAEAGIYASTAEAVVEYLCACKTLDELLRAYSSPNSDLTLHLATLCLQSDIPIRPYRLLAASCALRLRELLGASGT
jgi:hypothetical protein